MSKLEGTQIYWNGGKLDGVLCLSGPNDRTNNNGRLEEGIMIIEILYPHPVPELFTYVDAVNLDPPTDNLAARRVNEIEITSGGSKYAFEAILLSVTTIYNKETSKHKRIKQWLMRKLCIPFFASAEWNKRTVDKRTVEVAITGAVEVT